MRTARDWARSISAVIVLLGAVTAAIVAFTGRWDRAAIKLPPPRTVVLYSSVDDPIVSEVIARFRQEMGIIVEVVGDTEATRTTGLTQRLLAEKNAPRADVWWSSEPLGTVLLAREGVLAPMDSPPLDSEKGTPWPPEYKAKDGSWHAFALRARVIGYNSKWVKALRSPRSLRDLSNPDWKGKIGMARPQFGTTRTQMAALVALNGPEAFRAWLESLKGNDLRLYDGNSAVAKAIGMGEIDVGLTDTDDVRAAQSNAWPVAMNFEGVEGKVATSQGEESPGGALSHAEQAQAARQLASMGPLAIPNTVAVVKGCRHPREAQLLAEYLLSARTEALLAELEQHTQPIRPWLVQEHRQIDVPHPLAVDWEKVADALPEAMRICQEVLGN